ncbi:MAG: glycosyltransferase family 39 protein [Candidatus Vogelbacteria bacterium]|nr:glycosyltransferase family 39 protein [Candidatus Vogelbacteria bacterium]
MNKKYAGYILLVILVLAGFLRLYGLNRGDAISDEVLLAFRAIKMLDFDEGDFQTTPLEWFDKSDGGIPWWTGLSFHDHPPIVFLIQHVFMRIFGENSVAFRLPSVLFGLGSVFLIYLLGTLLFSVEAGLLSALLLSTTVNHVYVSRIGLQESYVIFFILLSLYYFFRSDKNDKYFLHSGLALGFGLLTKYTVGIVIPIILTYTLIWQRGYLKNRRFWLGGLWAIVTFSPVIIYNIEMYRAVGHFDFQISAMMGDRPAKWPVQPGKEIGSMTDRLMVYLPNLFATNSPIFILLLALSVVFFIYRFFFKVEPSRNTGYSGGGMRFFLVSFGWVAILMLFIGPQFRFLTMLTPFIALAIGLSLYNAYGYLLGHSVSKFLKFSIVIVFSVLLGFEIFYSWNSQIALYPVGGMNTFWSRLRFENYNWGYNELGKFLDEELEGKVPALTFDLKYDFLSRIRDEAVTGAIDSGAEPYPALIVWGGNFDKAGKLWTLDRLHIFHGWPIMSVSTYFSMLEERGADFFKRGGFTKSYFIFINNKVPDGNDRALSNGAEGVTIRNSNGDDVFYIYRKEI